MSVRRSGPRFVNRLGWLPGCATLLPLLACYGTLVLVAILGALGIAISLDEDLRGGAIVAFAALAVGGLLPGVSSHRQMMPLVVGCLGATTVRYAMYVRYDRLIEIAGFAILASAEFWDWRLRRAIESEPPNLVS